MLTERQERILEMLVKNPDGVVGSEISGKLAVSTRTVRTDIRSINQVLKKHNCAILSSTQQGYFLKEEEFPLISSLFFLYRQKRTRNSAEDRQYELLGLLLFEQAITFDEMEERIFASQQTLLRDMRKLSSKMKKRLGGCCFQVTGQKVLVQQQEELIRKYFLTLLQDESLVYGDFYNNHISFLLGDAYDEEEIKEWTSLVQSYAMEENLILSEELLFVMVWAICFSAIRNRNGYALAHVLPAQKTDARVLAILDRMTKNIDSFTTMDIAFLDHFMWPQKIAEWQEETSLDQNPILQDFCEEVNRKYGMDLKESKELYASLAAHIEYMIRRLKTGYEYDNPLKNDIREKYAYAYEIAMLLVPIVYRYQQKYLLEGEVSYIAIYIEYFMEETYQSTQVLLVVRNYSAPSRLIKNWLYKNFPNQIEIVDEVPVYRLEEYIKDNRNRIDCIISLSTIAHSEIPAYVMDEFPQPNDRLKIYELLNSIRHQRRFQTAIHHKFSKDLFLIGQEKNSFADVIETLCQMLQNEGIILDGSVFKEDLLMREQNYPTHLSPSFMAPHPLVATAVKSAIAVALFPKPLLHGGKEVRMVFVLALEPKWDEEMNDLFLLFRSIATQKQTYDDFMACKQFEDFQGQLLKMAEETIAKKP